MHENFGLCLRFEGIVEFVPEEVLHVWVVLEPGVVAVVERGNGGRDLTLTIENRNQNMLFVICRGRKGEGVRRILIFILNFEFAW